MRRRRRRASIRAARLRASTGRRRDADRKGKYWRFCLDHVRAYNASYNYFAGMTDDGGRGLPEGCGRSAIGPTWAMGVNPAGKAAEGESGRRQRDWEYLDPLGVLKGENFQRGPQGR